MAWTSTDLLEKLITLSDYNLYKEVKAVFEEPLKQIPEIFLISLSKVRLDKGLFLIDELLSLLLPQFLGNHINSIPVLQSLWNNNNALMIRGICELCRHDQRIMNYSRVLDITQEIKDSLLPIVNCDDYTFAVHLGVLAGKRDYLHFDVWVKARIQEVGTNFIKPLLKYIVDDIITPISTSDKSETSKNNILDRAHLCPEKLAMVMEHLSDLQNNSNTKIMKVTMNEITAV